MKKTLRIFSLLGAVAFVFLFYYYTERSQSQSQESEDQITGVVVKVMDGDTYELLTPDKTTVRVRMQGIDAPERGMPYYKMAKQYLSDLCMHQKVTLKEVTEDHYGRTVAFSYLEDGRELSREMLKAGYAWHYKKYNKESELAQMEKDAKAEKKGLWKDKNPTPPWEERAQRRKGKK